MTSQQIIDSTFNPKGGLSANDMRKYKSRLALLAELYFCNSKKEVWAVVASRGFICTALFAVKSILFDLSKFSSRNIDIDAQALAFMSGKHILECMES